MKIKIIKTVTSVAVTTTAFCACAATTATTTTATADEAKAAAKPNILFIMTDDQGAWSPSYTGHKGAFTPNLDRLKAQGMEFTHAYTTTPVCSPARATLMTSRYSSEVKIHDYIAKKDTEVGLEPEFVCWPTLLKNAGYKTALIGKWHLGHKLKKHHPHNHGYDYFMGFLPGGARAINTTLEVAGKTQKVPGLLVENLTDDAIRFIERNKDKTFCLSLHYRAPHDPQLPVSEEAWEKHRDGGHFVPKGHPDLNMEKSRKMMQEYCASVTDVDRNLGRLMTLLDELNLVDNTIVIFTSDHGYNVGHHGLQGKGNGGWMTKGTIDSHLWPNINGKKRPNMFDTSLRVPFIVRWPKVIKAGSECSRTIDFTDMYPTLCTLGGATIPADVKIHGNDFSPFLYGKTVEWDDEFYSEYDLTEKESWNRRRAKLNLSSKTHMRCWRTPNWKLMVDFNNKGRWELYNLKKDPGETNNLKNSKEAEPIKKALFAKIIKKMNEIKDPVRKKIEAWKVTSGF